MRTVRSTASSMSGCSSRTCAWNGSCGTFRRAWCGPYTLAPMASSLSRCSHWWRFQPVALLSFHGWAYRVSILLFPLVRIVQPAQYNPRTRYRPHLRLRGILAGSSLSPPFGTSPGVHAARLLAAALSLSATGALMALFRVSHPPAGATTLIVSLGVISQPRELVIIEVAVILLTLQAFFINRLAGIPYSIWRRREPARAAL